LKATIIKNARRYDNESLPPVLFEVKTTQGGRKQDNQRRFHRPVGGAVKWEPGMTPEIKERR
jgi:hypothetical protein